LLLAQFTAAASALTLAAESFQSQQSQSPPAPVVLLVQKLFQKIVYALGSLLRGNRPAQVHFCAAGGPEVLGTTLTGLLRREDQKGSPSTTHARKMTKRLLMLADDIVSDVKLNHYHHQEDKSPAAVDEDETIVQAFASAQWCELAVLALQTGDSTIHETALLTVATLAGQCISARSWNMEVVQQAIFQIRDHWKTGPGSESMDPDILQERLELIESTMNVLTTAEESKEYIYSRGPEVQQNKTD
jgi:hypothetical protein